MNMDNLDQGTLGQDAPDAGRGQKRGWWSRNWRRLVLVLLAVIVLGGVGGYWALFLRIYGLKECQSAMKAIQADKEVEKALGKPVEPVYWPSQESAPSAQIDVDRIDIRWSIQGPKGRARAQTVILRRQGNVSVAVELADGRKILIGTDEGGDVAPPYGSGTAPPFEGPKTEKKPEADAPPPEINLPAPPAETPGKA
jgi:hypothetical protein